MESDYDYLNKVFSYNAQSGLVYWKIRPRWNVKIDDVAGNERRNGYIYICYKAKRYTAHRIAWLLTYKEWPSSEIDHINGIPSDNKISNLRVVSHRSNMQNKIQHRNGKSAGTQYIKRNNNWNAKIWIDGTNYHLGTFDSEKDAIKAYAFACSMYDNDASWRPPLLPSRRENALGCYYNKTANKWCAQIRIGKEHRFLGNYNTAEEAHAAYLRAKNVLN